jgi:hypothetical protein
LNLKISSLIFFFLYFIGDFAMSYIILKIFSPKIKTVEENEPTIHENEEEDFFESNFKSSYTNEGYSLP